MQKINIADLDTNLGRELSFFSDVPFEYQGIEYTSIESFVQSLKFDNAETREHIASLEAYKARMRGKKRTKALTSHPYIKWNNEEIEIFSDEYYNIIYQAILHKFQNNRRAITALLLTNNYQIYFDNGYPEPTFNTLPYEMYINMLLIARDELKENLRSHVAGIYNTH